MVNVIVNTWILRKKADPNLQQNTLCNFFMISYPINILFKVDMSDENDYLQFHKIIIYFIKEIFWHLHSVWCCCCLDQDIS